MYFLLTLPSLLQFYLLHILPSLLHGPFHRFLRRSERRRHENILRKVLTNAIAGTDNVTAQNKNCPSSAFNDRPGKDLFRVLKRLPISQPHILGLRRGCTDGKAVGNTAGL